MKPIREEYPRLYHGGRYHRREFERGLIMTTLETSDGTILSYIEMSDYGVKGALPWHESCLHKGLIKSCTLVAGWAHFIYGKGQLHSCRYTEPGQTIKFFPGTPHTVLFGPGAKIITTLFGTPSPNPDRNGEDWWLADNVFTVPAVLEQAKIEEELCFA
jgi:hypothetical protein